MSTIIFVQITEQQPFVKIRDASLGTRETREAYIRSKQPLGNKEISGL